MKLATSIYIIIIIRRGLGEREKEKHQSAKLVYNKGSQKGERERRRRMKRKDGPDASPSTAAAAALARECLLMMCPFVDAALSSSKAFRQGFSFPYSLFSISPSMLLMRHTQLETIRPLLSLSPRRRRFPPEWSPTKPFRSPSALCRRRKSFAFFCFFSLSLFFAFAVKLIKSNVKICSTGSYFLL